MINRSIFSVNYYHRCLLHGCIAEMRHSHSVYWSFHPSQAFGVFGVLFFIYPINGLLLYLCHKPICTLLKIFIIATYILRNTMYLFSQSTHKLYRTQHWGLGFWALCLYILDRLDKSQALDLCSMLVWTSEWMSEPSEERNISKVYLCPTSTLNSPESVEVVIIELLRCVERTQNCPFTPEVFI